MATRFILNHAGMRSLLSSTAVRADLLRRAERVAAAARSTAPVSSGRYRASLRVEADVSDRAAARVRADVPYAMAVEAGHRTLGRATDAAR